MRELPPPLPPNCDLRNFGDMPLAVNRLRDSEIASINDAEVFRCAVLAWCAAWHQVPAASLPDDDATIARMVGMGRDVKGWKKLRQAGALRGFHKATDGRLYHRVVAEKAAESWTSKLEFAWRRECDRLRKVNKERATSGEPALEFPPKPAKVVSGWSADGAEISDGIPADEPKDRGGGSDGNGPSSDGIPSVLPQKGREHKGLDIKEPPSASARASPPAEPSGPDPAQRNDPRGKCLAIVEWHFPNIRNDLKAYPALTASIGLVDSWLGDGCELERDVLPAIEAECLKLVAKARTPRGFGWFTDAVAANKSRNSAPLPESKNGHHRASNPAPGKPLSAGQRLLAELAGIAGADAGGPVPVGEPEPGIVVDAEFVTVKS